VRWRKKKIKQYAGWYRNSYLSYEEVACCKDATHIHVKAALPGEPPRDEEESYIGKAQKRDIRHERETEDKKHGIGDKDNSRNKTFTTRTPQLPQRAI
jgi:hypothetical protein